MSSLTMQGIDNRVLQSREFTVKGIDDHVEDYPLDTSTTVKTLLQRYAYSTALPVDVLTLLRGDLDGDELDDLDVLHDQEIGADEQLLITLDYPSPVLYSLSSIFDPKPSNDDHLRLPLCLRAQKEHPLLWERITKAAHFAWEEKFDAVKTLMMDVRGCMEKVTFWYNSSSIFKKKRLEAELCLGEGHEALLGWVLDQGADVNELVDDISLVAWAAALGNRGAVELLIQRHAQLELADQHGHTPLCWAARFGHENICRFLIERGAKMHDIPGCADHLHPGPMAFARGHYQLAKYLHVEGMSQKIAPLICMRQLVSSGRAEVLTHVPLLVANLLHLVFGSPKSQLYLPFEVFRIVVGCCCEDNGFGPCWAKLRECVNSDACASNRKVVPSARCSASECDHRHAALCSQHNNAQWEEGAAPQFHGYRGS